MMCTILSGSTGGIFSAFLKPLVMGTYSQYQRYDVGALSNGIISGLVSISGVCDRCEPWSAFLIGLIGSVVYTFACKAMKSAGVDDPVEATMVHGGCGMWGVIAVGIFDNKYGLISDSIDSVSYFGWQVGGALIITLWTLSFTLPYFLIMKRLGLLRVPLLFEVIGLDIAEMGSKAHIDDLIAMSIYRAHQMNRQTHRIKESIVVNNNNNNNNSLSLNINVPNNADDDDSINSCSLRQI